MTKTNIPSYVGSFKVKKELTKRLNYGDWLIYRDPENGIYLYSPEYDDEVNPLLWNITTEEWSENLRQLLIHDIEEALPSIIRRNECIKRCPDLPTSLKIKTY